MKQILFNTDMVRAILAGRKTVTRRVVNHKHLRGLENLSAEKIQRACVVPYRPGDILYVRETWTTLIGSYLYRADQKPNMKNAGKWRPSIHMPREAARIFLRVTDVRVERLQDCGNAQAKDEGCTCCSQFARIWDSTIKSADRDRYGWAANPWVWVIEFERCEKPEGDVTA